MAKLFETMTWIEFKGVREEVKVAIVPWGAIEAHGVHLPLATDTIIVDHIAKLVAEEINALKLPAIPIGYSYHASNFPGTISFTEETLKHIAWDIARSLEAHQIQKIIFLAGHGGNVTPLEEIAERIRKELKIAILVIFLYYTEDHLIEQFNQVKTSRSIEDIFHAEELETSIMLAISPELVNMKEAKVEYPEISEEYLRYEKKLGDLTEYCVFGDPSVATAEKGKQFIGIILKEILRIVKSSENYPP